MPIYEFACKACGQEFETLTRASTLPACPTCQSTALDKKLSVFATATATESKGAAMPVMPGPCGSCGNPAGPGACGWAQ